MSHALVSTLSRLRTSSDVRGGMHESAIRSIAPLYRTPLLAFIVAFGYYIGLRIGFSFTPSQTPIGTFWPPNAILLAALLLAPSGIWWSFILAVLPVHLLVQLHSGVPVLTSLGWFVGNTGEALIGAIAVRHFKREKLLFEGFQNVVTFLVFGVLIAPLVTSFVDAATVVLTRLAHGYWMLWATRLSSNMLSDLVIVPTIVMFALCGASWVQKATIARWVEAALLACALVFVTFLVFGRQYTIANSIPGLICIPLPFLVWAAVRFGVAGVSASALVAALISIWNTMHHWGPLASGTAEDVLSLHVLLGAFASLSMLFAAVVAERRHDEKSLRIMRRQLLDSAEQERRRVARELHDDIVQRLTLLDLELQRVESESNPVLRQSLNSVRERLSRASEATRGLSHHLHPFVLEYLGLEKALRSLCRQTGTLCSITINFSSENVPARLPFEISLCLYRVAQEALQNIVKHSQAHIASISLRVTDQRAFLRIVDDGIGMDVEQQRGEGIGFASIRERVAAADGTLQISSVPSAGTTIEVSVPLVALAK